MLSNVKVGDYLISGHKYDDNSNTYKIYKVSRIGPKTIYMKVHETYEIKVKIKNGASIPYESYGHNNFWRILTEEEINYCKEYNQKKKICNVLRNYFWEALSLDKLTKINGIIQTGVNK